MFPLWTIYVYVLLLGIYSMIIVPYYVSKMMVKKGYNEHFWFFIVYFCFIIPAWIYT